MEARRCGRCDGSPAAEPAPVWSSPSWHTAPAISTGQLVRKSTSRKPRIRRSATNAPDEPAIVSQLGSQARRPIGDASHRAAGMSTTLPARSHIKRQIGSGFAEIKAKRHYRVAVT
jgi:hypothetical protein